MSMIEGRGESLTKQVHRAIQRAIIVGDMAPGSLHSVAKLAERLEVSRSPVREALITLADQGMVAFERNRGVRVLESTIHDLEEVIGLRYLLEVPATFRVAELVTDEQVARLHATLGAREDFTSAETMQAHQELDHAFHREIMLSAGNRRLVGIVDNLWAHQKLRGLSAVSRSRLLTDIYDEHAQILERIEDRDPAGSAAAMQTHLRQSAQYLLAHHSGQEHTDVVEDLLPWFRVSAAAHRTDLGAD